MSRRKYIWISLIFLIVIILVCITVAAVRLQVRTIHLEDDYQYLYERWTLHYSLITGLDFQSDEITISNPYGYTEVIPIASFLDRTSFKAYENMPIFLKLGFMFDVFEKNTIFIIEPAPKYIIEG